MKGHHIYPGEREIKAQMKATRETCRERFQTWIEAGCPEMGPETSALDGWLRGLEKLEWRVRHLKDLVPLVPVK